MSKPASGIRTTVDGQSVIPSSRRADGSTRKEIKVRPGYKPPEDVETYKSRNAENWRTKPGNVPGTEESRLNEAESDTKSKNAKRREAARRKKELEEDLQPGTADELGALVDMNLGDKQVNTAAVPVVDDQSSEMQKKIRNNLKRLKAIQELKAKKAAGERLSADQLIKIGKEQEIIRDLVKLDYNGPEISNDTKDD